MDTWFLIEAILLLLVLYVATIAVLTRLHTRMKNMERMLTSLTKELNGKPK